MGLKIDCVIGIDPGANGGIAVYIPGRLTKVVKMPKDITDLAEFLKYYKENNNPIVFLEKLSVRPDDVAVGADGKPNMGKIYRIQKMIANFEHLKATIEMTGVPYALVHPQKWINYLNLKRKDIKEEKADRKRRFCQVAGEWYPEIRTTLWNADALLILNFGRKVLVNDVNWVRENIPVREHNKIF